MNKKEAQKQLRTGYLFAVAGFIAGILPPGLDTDFIFFSGLLLAYAFWGTYWGFRIASKPVKNFFDGSFSAEKGLRNFAQAKISHEVKLFVITLFIGYFVGLLGGGIYKQIALMKIK